MLLLRLLQPNRGQAGLCSIGCPLGEAACPAEGPGQGLCPRLPLAPSSSTQGWTPGGEGLPDRWRSWLKESPGPCLQGAHSPVGRSHGRPEEDCCGHSRPIPATGNALEGLQWPWVNLGWLEPGLRAEGELDGVALAESGSLFRPDQSSG